MTTSADTIILRNGKKKTGEIVSMDQRSITLQVDDFLQLKLNRANVKQIITNSPAGFAGDSKATSFVYEPKSEKASKSVPKGDAADPNKFRVPGPVLVNRLDFKSKPTRDGESDGKTIGPDGRPMSDHKIYANDTKYFVLKCRDGMVRTTPKEELERLSELRYLAHEVATVLHLASDLKTGIMLESPARTQKKLQDTYDRFKKEATRYFQEYEQQAMKAPEYPLAELLAKMDSAIRTYNMCHKQLFFGERLGMRDRIDLEGGRTERGRMLRWRLKVTINQMAQARSEVLKKYKDYFKFGLLRELPGGTRPKAWTIVHDQALLFPYVQIEVTAAYDGLREDFEQQKITKAQPYILDPDQVVVFVQRKTIAYPAGKDGGRSAEIEVVEIRLADASASSYRTKKKLPLTDLRGWLLADRVQLVSH